LATHLVFGAWLTNQWVSAQTCIEAIKCLGNLSTDIAKALDVGIFNQAMSKSMKHLRKDLQEASVNLPLGRPKLADLQILALQHRLQITIAKQKILPGWEGKPKGILQILWECG